MADALAGLDPELSRRVKVVMANLSMLSEGKASAPHSLAPPVGRRPKVACPQCNGVSGGRCARCKGRGEVAGDARHRSTQPHHESSIPAGVNLDRNPREAPSKDENLYQHYLWMFARALRLQDQEQVRALCFAAERDWVKAIGRPSEDPKERLAAQRRFILTTTGKEPTEDELIDAAVRLYEGYPKEQAAAIEGCSVGFIEKARRRRRRRAEDGRREGGWRGWSDEERIARIRELRQRHWKQEQVAGEFGVTARSIRPYWGHAEPRRAA